MGHLKSKYRELIFASGGFATGVALVIFAWAFQQPRQPVPPQFLLPPSDLKYFTFGYRENVADSIWLRVIQDFDFCEATKDRKQDYEPGVRKNEGCKLGWVYHMVDAVTELAPNFRIPYVAGGLMLNTVVNDEEGARKILEKGVTQFPKDWNILYYAAFNALDYQKDPAKAADLLVRSGENGAPAWVISLAGRLYTRTGKALLAKSVLERAIQEQSEERWVPTLKKRLEMINEELNSALREANSDRPLPMKAPEARPEPDSK